MVVVMRKENQIRAALENGSRRLHARGWVPAQICAPGFRRVARRFPARGWVLAEQACIPRSSPAMGWNIYWLYSAPICPPFRLSGRRLAFSLGHRAPSCNSARATYCKAAHSTGDCSSNSRRLCCRRSRDTTRKTFLRQKVGLPQRPTAMRFALPRGHGLPLTALRQGASSFLWAASRSTPACASANRRQSVLFSSNI